MKTWLKGGLILGIVGLISSLIYLFGASAFSNGNTPQFVIWIFAPFMIIGLPGLIISLFLGVIQLCLPFSGLCPPSKINPYVGFIFATIINFIFYFFVGSLIGYIVSKSRKK